VHTLQSHELAHLEHAERLAAARVERRRRAVRRRARGRPPDRPATRLLRRLRRLLADPAPR